MSYIYTKQPPPPPILRFSPEGSGKKATVLTATKAKPQVAASETVEELEDIREWNQPSCGVTAERLRNCILYQLDYVSNSWYADKLTVAALGREGFVTKLDEDTPPGWTPEKAKKSYRRVKPLPRDMASWMMTGPGVNEPREGWTSGRQKMDKIKICWYGRGGENQPDPLTEEEIEALFARYQAGITQ